MSLLLMKCFLTLPVPRAPSSFSNKSPCLSFIMDFPGGASGEEPACQCRRCKRSRLDPWVRKISWRRAWQPTPVFLPGESHGQRSLVGYSPWDHKESDRTEHTRAYTRTHTQTFSQQQILSQKITKNCVPSKSRISKKQGRARSCQEARSDIENKTKDIFRVMMKRRPKKTTVYHTSEHSVQVGARGQKA